MADRLVSVGLDVGTTTTQLILSQLCVENRASGFAVPQMEITDRQILYRSPVFFTPLSGKDRVDGEALRNLVAQQYEAAGIRRESVDTGAIIITGETSRKENAEAVLHALSSFAGEFVVATAGPDLESILAAKGAGAVAYSEKTGQTVLHMDIGGGTSNLALIEKGRIVQTGCFNVGGRLLRKGYVSPVLSGIGADPATVIPKLVQVLEMAAGLRPVGELFDILHTRETENRWIPPAQRCVISFSGGVADCIETALADDTFGDIGPALGQAIRKSLLCRGPYRLGQETVGATVIGAGCHSATLSGSTVYHRQVDFPLQNLPVCAFTEEEQESPALAELVKQRLRGAEKQPVLMLPGYAAPGYGQVKRLAAAISQGAAGSGVYVCVLQDMAKALGQYLGLLLPETSLLCIDGVRLREGDYLDVGNPVGPALPVVVKTLVLQKNDGGDL